MSSKQVQIAAQRLSVSFCHLDETRQKFALSLGDAEYFADVVGRLKALTQLTKAQFIALQSTGKAWRVHRIDWRGQEHPVSETSFRLPASLGADDNAWQFMTSKRTGRVHGYLAGDTFFVVWFDPTHALYNGNRD